MPTTPHRPRPACRWVNVVGIRRRIQALAVMGWPRSEIARRLGYTSPTLWFMDRRVRRVSHHVADRVHTITAELGTREGPSNHVRRYAIRAGWASLLQWDDADIDDPTARPQRDATYITLPSGKKMLDLGEEGLVDPARMIDHVAVRRAVSGHPPAKLREVDRRLAIEILSLRGLTQDEISRRLRCPERAVSRNQNVLRALGRLPAGRDTSARLPVWTGRYEDGAERDLLEMPRTAA